MFFCKTDKTVFFAWKNFSMKKTITHGQQKILKCNLIVNHGTASTYNSTLAIGGVPSPLESFVVAESSVLRTNFCAEKPAHRQSAKRYVQH